MGKLKHFFVGSLQRQLVCGMFTVHLVLTLVLVTEIIQFQTDLLHNRLLVLAKNYTNLLSHATRHTLMSLDLVGLQEQIQHSADLADLEYISVTDLQGKVLAHTSPHLIGKFMTDKISQDLFKTRQSEATLPLLVVDSSESIEAAIMVSAANRSLGWLRVGLSTKNNKYTTVNFVSQVLLVGFFAIAIGVLLSIFMATQVLARLRKLSSCVELYQTHGEVAGFELGKDELGKLAQEIKQFILEIISKDKQIKQDKGLLENTVTARIQELQEALKSLQTTKDDLELIVDNVPGLIFFKDDKNNFIRVNRFVAEAYQLTKNQMENRNLSDLASPDIAKKYFDDDLKVINGKQPLLNIEEPWDTATERRWLLTSKIPVMRKNDGCESVSQGVLGISMDITERKRAELKLIESERLFRTLFENAPDAFLILDLVAGTILDCNHATENMLKGPKSRIIGLTPDQISPEYQPEGIGSKELALNRIAKALKEGSNRFTWIHRRLDGGEFWADVSITMGRYNEKEALFASWRDMTEQKNLEANLRRSNAELEQFAHSASHDLQEPLRSISSFTELLRDEYQGQLSPEADRYIEFVISGAKRMKAMINDLLSYSRLNSSPIKKAPMNLSEACQFACENLSHLITRTGAVVNIHLDVQAYGDVTQLTQLFQNLIRNAIIYSKKDLPPKVEVTFTETHQEVRVFVRDEGIGIESKYFDRIFEIFKRLHSTEKYEGTGIGLALCKKIVDRHGGRIWLESKLGEGSTFIFTLPK